MSKLFHHPIITPERSDYMEGISYEAKVVGKIDLEKKQATIQHELKGDCVIAAMIREGKAKFACTISIPMTMYRTLEIHDKEINSDPENARQIVSWVQENHHEDIFIMPRVICVKDSGAVEFNSSGFNHLFKEDKISFSKNLILALGEGIHSEPLQVESLIVPEPDENLAPGQIKVLEGDDGIFKLRMDQRTYDTIKAEKNSNAYNIARHALTVVFSIIHEKYKESNDDPLQGDYADLAKALESKRIPLWNTWGDIGESEFTAEMAATKFEPYKME